MQNFAAQNSSRAKWHISCHRSLSAPYPASKNETAAEKL